MGRHSGLQRGGFPFISIQGVVNYNLGRMLSLLDAVACRIVCVFLQNYQLCREALARRHIPCHKQFILPRVGSGKLLSICRYGNNSKPGVRFAGGLNLAESLGKVRGGGLVWLFGTYVKFGRLERGC